MEYAILYISEQKKLGKSTGKSKLVCSFEIILYAII